MLPIATIGAGCLVIENESVLLVQPNYGKAKNAWILPGGFVEPGEHPEVGALRELLEETGQTGEIISPLCVRFRTETPDVYYVYRARRLFQSEIKTQAEELLDVRFLPIEEALRSETVRPMTRYFIQAAVGGQRDLKIPKPYDETNFVYFIS